MATYKTPGVYIEEKSAFPNSVVGVETAVPAFIGYTQKASFNGQSLLYKPIKIESFKEYVQFFGGAFKTTYELVDSDDPTLIDVNLNGKNYALRHDVNTRYNLYNAMKLFYQNGGGTCFVVSIGLYGSGKPVPDFSNEPFEKGIKTLEKETEPTMLLIPDAILGEEANCFSLQQQMLRHCGEQMNRIAILDIYGGDKGLDDPIYNPIDNFRNGVSSDFLSYGTAYYPWLHTTVVQSNEVNFTNLNKNSLALLQGACSQFIGESNKKSVLKPYIDALKPQSSSNPDSKKEVEPEDESVKQPEIDVKTVNTVLLTAIPAYKQLMDAILKKENLMAPGAAMAGIYTSVDNQRGVWKAPANVSMSSVVAPAVLIDDKKQEDLNAPILGKSICAIRPFIGMGVMVWGARTLDANSLDWRYINVRRTMIMLEQSIKFAAKAYVFEPNVKNTWVSIQAMISNFLNNIWKQGGLAGASPLEAFSVNVGLGATMTAVDILEGKMIIEIKVAISRPAEFIVISFEQQMQKS